MKEYKAFFPKLKTEDTKIRIITLVSEKFAEEVILREDLMNEDYPSIWLQVKNSNKKDILLCGQYREWDHEGKKLFKTKWNEFDSSQPLYRSQQKKTNI